MSRDIRYDPADRPKDEQKRGKDHWRKKIISAKQQHLRRRRKSSMVRRRTRLNRMLKRNKESKGE